MEYCTKITPEEKMIQYIKEYAEKQRKTMNDAADDLIVKNVAESYGISVSAVKNLL